jgi:hypothetical protein
MTINTPPQVTEPSELPADVERVARAMCTAAGFDPDEIMANDGPRWRYYDPSARAAIAAMQPSPPVALLDGTAPGPYATERDLPHNCRPRIWGADGSLICEVGSMGTSQDEWEANAALLAAAPDLARENARLVTQLAAQAAEIAKLRALLSKVQEETIGNKVGGGDGNTYVVRPLSCATFNAIHAALANGGEG